MELPLFPLNSVLFPGMPLRLHIFEERYKEMINQCIDNQSPFGVVLIKTGSAEGSSVARPYLVGTTAHITQVQRLPYGRMNISAIGRDRFQINELDLTSQSFLMSEVDLLSFNDSHLTFLETRARKLQPLLKRYVLALIEAGQLQFDIEQLPTTPLPLAFLAASLLQAEDSVKQKLLEASSASDLFVELLKTYQKEVSLIDILLSPPQSEENNTSPFSLN